MAEHQQVGASKAGYELTTSREGGLPRMYRKENPSIPYSVSKRTIGGIMHLNYEQCSVCRSIRITNGSQHSGWMPQQRIQSLEERGHTMERVKLVHCSQCATVPVKILL